MLEATWDFFCKAREHLCSGNQGLLLECFLPFPSWSLLPRTATDQTVLLQGFPGGAVVENPPANAGDTGSVPGLGGSHMPRSN